MTFCCLQQSAPERLVSMTYYAARSFVSGMAVQSFLVPDPDAPNNDKREVRLFITIHRIPPRTSTVAGDTSIVRFNVNTMGAGTTLTKVERVVSKNPPPDVPYARFLTTNGPHWSFARLAFADGKIYYMRSSAPGSAVLTSTDVSMRINCAAAMPLIAASFRKWDFSDAQLGSGSHAGDKTYKLKETPRAQLPWLFQAYRNVVQFKNVTVMTPTLAATPLTAEWCRYIKRCSAAGPNLPLHAPQRRHAVSQRESCLPQMVQLPLDTVH